MIKLIPLLYESDKVLTTRRTPEERQKNYQKALEKQKVLVQKKISDYAANPEGPLRLIDIDFDITLPDNLYVDGELELSRTMITKLPKGLKIKGSLLASGTPITEIPADIEIGWALSLAYCGRIKYLPDFLHVPSSLYLLGSSIVELPDNLTVGRYLDASRSEIAKIGKNLKVGHDLDITQSPIQTKYSKSEIRRMIEETGGSVKGIIK